MFHEKDIMATFNDLTFTEQTKVINTQIVALRRSIRAHIKKATAECRPAKRTEKKFRAQIQRLITRI